MKGVRSSAQGLAPHKCPVLTEALGQPQTGLGASGLDVAVKQAPAVLKGVPPILPCTPVSSWWSWGLAAVPRLLRHFLQHSCPGLLSPASSPKTSGVFSPGLPRLPRSTGGAVQSVRPTLSSEEALIWKTGSVTLRAQVVRCTPLTAGCVFLVLRGWCSGAHVPDAGSDVPSQGPAALRAVRGLPGLQRTGELRRRGRGWEGVGRGHGGSGKHRARPSPEGRWTSLSVAGLSPGGHPLPLEEFSCKGAKTRLGRGNG